MSIEAERWDALCRAFAKYADETSEVRFHAGRLANILGRELRAYIGMNRDDDRVIFYQYEPAHDAEYDEFTKAASGMDAVSQMKDGRWGYALGIELERMPGTVPRMIVRWLVFLDMASDPVQVELGLTKEKLPFRHSAGKWNVEPICKAIFENLRDGLLQGAKDSGTPLRIGFV